jgi:hypothetical protein
MISPRRIFAVLTFATLAGCASPSDSDRSGAADTTPNANTTESPPADTARRGGNVMGGGH